MPARIHHLCALLFFLAALCLAQYKTRTVSGTVTDHRGNPLPKAVVQLENQIDLSIRSYITAADGRYHFAGVTDEFDFTLRARYRTYWSKTKRLSEFNSSPNPQIDLMIPIE